MYLNINDDEHNIDELTDLDLSGSKLRTLRELPCPNCGSFDYREVRIPSEERGDFPADGIEHNVCYICDTRFDLCGKVMESSPALKSIAGVVGIVIGVFALITFIGLIGSSLGIK
ncbi:MAG: hypothetical protein R2747_02375 [Pyrinomonadaceae bacterium]